MNTELRLAPCAGTSTPTGSRSRGRRTRRSARLSQPLDVGPPVPDRRLGRRPVLRGLHDPRRVGAGDRARPRRADGRCQPVPQPGADGQDGHDARPHQQRPGVPGHRLGVERRRGARLRHRVRRVAGRAAALAARGAAGDARHAPRRGAVRAPGRAIRSITCATTRCPCRRTCRCSSAVAARTSRCASSRATAMPTNIGFAAGWRASFARSRRCAGTARRWAATTARSSGRSTPAR